MYRLLLFEKNNFMREAMRRILRESLPELVVREVMTFEECMSVLSDFNPDIILVSLTYHSGEDLDRLRRIRSKDPAATIMLLMDYDIDEYRREAILNGANYIISRDLWTGEEILALVKSILSAGRETSHFMSGEVDVPGRPVERRNKGRVGRRMENEFLKNNPDRRKWN